MKHPLAAQIKIWADDPEAWQWQLGTQTSPLVVVWNDCRMEEALDEPTRARLIPKRNMIPAHLLPEGWEEAELLPCGGYRLLVDGVPWRCSGSSYAGQLLHHIDPEAK